MEGAPQRPACGVCVAGVAEKTGAEVCAPARIHPWPARGWRRCSAAPDHSPAAQSPPPLYARRPAGRTLQRSFTVAKAGVRCDDCAAPDHPSQKCSTEATLQRQTMLPSHDHATAVLGSRMFRTPFRARIIAYGQFHGGAPRQRCTSTKLAISARLTVSFLVISMSDKGLALVNPFIDQRRLQRRMQAAMQQCEAPARGRDR